MAEHRRLPADDTTLLGWLAALPGPVTVAMEATLYGAWMHVEAPEDSFVPLSLTRGA